MIKDPEKLYNNFQNLVKKCTRILKKIKNIPEESAEYAPNLNKFKIMMIPLMEFKNKYKDFIVFKRRDSVFGSFSKDLYKIWMLKNGDVFSDLNSVMNIGTNKNDTNLNDTNLNDTNHIDTNLNDTNLDDTNHNDTESINNNLILRRNNSDSINDFIILSPSKKIISGKIKNNPKIKKINIENLDINEQISPIVNVKSQMINKTITNNGQFISNKESTHSSINYLYSKNISKISKKVDLMNINKNFICNRNYSEVQSLFKSNLDYHNFKKIRTNFNIINNISGKKSHNNEYIVNKSFSVDSNVLIDNVLYKTSGMRYNNKQNYKHNVSSLYEKPFYKPENLEKLNSELLFLYDEISENNYASEILPNMVYEHKKFISKNFMNWKFFY
ncbi:hypothetical protein DMUE_3419 [Dictyocoela muelleri]|nr:hypothetical protein DMUE_3419 [Dictyocoela muelleri]